MSNVKLRNGPILSPVCVASLQRHVVELVNKVSVFIRLDVKISIIKA